MADKITPELKTPEQVAKIVEDMQRIETVRANNRVLINNCFNGRRPFTPEEEAKLQIQVNVNWNEGSNLLQSATRQINSALLFKESFFRLTCVSGELEKRQVRGEKATVNIQKPLKKGASGKKHLFLMRDRNASLALHGLGPMMWLNSYDWMPVYIPLEDLLIPTDTKLDNSNLAHFAVHMYPTPYQLYTMTHGKKVDKGWNVPFVDKILASYKDVLQSPNDLNWAEQPERVAELWKQNCTYADSDAVAKVYLTYFFYQDRETGKWHRQIILRKTQSGTDSPVNPIANQPTTEFLYDGRDTAFAEELDQILHTQVGDNSLVAPLKYHSVRGLGQMLYGVIECVNRLRCQFTQHVFEQLLMYFRINNPADRDRPKNIQLFPYGIIEEGVEIVPKDQRHQIDPRLVAQAMSEFRSLMSENSASYVQDLGKSSQGEAITATEAMARLQSVNVQVSSMLQMVYELEGFYYEEILRRFMNPNSDDKQVQEFQQKCKKDGIPEALMKPEHWKLTVERVLGAGDQMMAEREATQLMGVAPQLDPPAQRIVKRQYISTITRDPAKGQLLVPDDPDPSTKGRRAAEEVFGTLMEGIKVSIRHGIEREDYILALIEMAEIKVQMIEATGNVGTPDDIIGLQKTIEHIAENIEILSQDESKKQMVKMFGDRLGQIENMVKAFAQRLEEQMAKEAENQDAEAQAKAQSTVMLAQTKAKISEMESQQRMQQNQMEFEQRMAQMMKEHELTMQTRMLELRTNLIEQTTKAKTDIEIQKEKANVQNEVTRSAAATAAAAKSNGDK